ncbi:MAG: glycoside hydrolase family 28 protein [Ferruginibacter sp.]
MKYLLLIMMVAVAFAANAQSTRSLPAIETVKFKKDTFSIVKYGAVADGVTLNTKSINDAITACNKKGGGVVMIPEGMWLTGPVEIKSNVNLYLKAGSVLQFTDDKSQYNLYEGNFEGLKAVRNQSPVSATNATNIAITGSGIIDGNGDAWRMVRKDKLNETQWKKLVASGGLLSDDKKTWYPSQGSFAGSSVKNPGVIENGKTIKDYEAIKDFLRPNLLLIANCKKVLLEGVTFQNSPAWCMHPLMSSDIIIRNVYAKNPFYAQNGDGLDLESCKNVLIENSTFDVGDDGICIKSGRDEQGRKRNMPTENVVIRKCVVYHAHGGFVIGSEMSGGAKNIYVSDCSFIGTDIGLRFKTTRGRGGIVENIFIDHIVMKDIAAEALLFDMYYMAKDPVVLAGETREEPKVELFPVDAGTPQFKNFYIKNIVCNGADKAIFIRGLPEMSIKNIYLQDMTLKARVGMDCTEATGISLKNINLITKETKPVLRVDNSRDITLDNIKYNSGADLLINLSGEKTSAVKMLNTNVAGAKQKATFTAGATAAMLEIK